jgi:moderate conductance mechanosensitive channel
MPFDLSSPCQDDEAICRQVEEWTDSNRAANVADLLVGKPLVLVGLFLGMLVVRWVAHRLIDRVVRRAEEGVLPRGAGRLRWRHRPSPAEEQAHLRDLAATTRRAQRSKTIGDLFKSIVTGVLVAVVGTMMLSEVGVDIAPIIASAGIIGIALGFGAQSLVKDFLSGVFMIVEDQYGVGDVVDLGEASGTVEQVTLRVTRLRSIDGTVWYVPNGEILRVGNMSQNWSRAVVDVAVSYREDLSRVRRLLGEVAHDLREDEDYRELVIEEPEVTGVETLTLDAVTLRVMVKTLPMEQWAAARELRQRIKARFDHEGVEVPSSPRVVWSRVGPQPTAERDAAGGDGAGQDAEV